MGYFWCMKLIEQALGLERIDLLARDDARNIRREYRIERSVDLFGHHIVEWGWGRIGTGGQARKISFEGEEGAIRFIRSLLARRDTAQKRLGTPYRLMAAATQPMGPQSKDRTSWPANGPEIEGLASCPL